MCYCCAVTDEPAPLRIRIVKSSRHSKIVGSFGEGLVCNWLSRAGFEVSIVDHSGIDLVAYNRASKQRLGISVKSRTRLPNTESESVYIFRRPRDRNALKSGIRAESEVLPWEDPAERAALGAEYVVHNQPRTPQERALVDNLAHGEFLFRRFR